MNQETQDYSEQTRAIYHQQHTRIANDSVAMKRFINMFSTEYFGLDESFFKGKKILDAGCGDTAKVIIAMSKMGATEVHGLDLGEEFIPVATQSMKNQGVDPNNVSLKSGSVLDMPYEDERFDFVICHGVLLHLNSLEEVEIAFKELARVTKPGGLLYTVYGIVGGLLEAAIIPAVREYYNGNREFKQFIDNVSPENFEDAGIFVERMMKEHTGEVANLDILTSLLDVDFCVMLQNLIQAPVRLSVPEKMIREMYDESGFCVPRRLGRYVKRQNLRKYLAPFHYDHDNATSQLFWGSGNLEFIGEKR